MGLFSYRLFGPPDETTARHYDEESFMLIFSQISKDPVSRLEQMNKPSRRSAASKQLIAGGSQNSSSAFVCPGHPAGADAECLAAFPPCSQVSRGNP